MRNVGILVFNEVEELDFTGPLEVFGAAGRLKENSFRPFTIASSSRTVRGRYGLRISPEYTFRSCPHLDLLVVPGGRGSRREMRKIQTLEFVRRRAASCELVTSVCTGALILAAAGLLDNKKATTHWAALDELRAFPSVKVQHARYLRQGKVITSGGVSAGIDMALYVVGRLHGRGFQRKVARQIEYRLLRPGWATVSRK
jgi:transcriptional regulator GlxA family with amidase domain